MNVKPKQYFLKLLNKLFDDTITKKELEKLSYFFLNNQELKNWPEHFGSKTQIEERIYNKIQSDIKSGSSKENKVIPLYKKSLFKYAVASSVVLLISLTYILNRDNASITVSPIIVNNNIVPGTDKATLTLEDGSVVALEEGKTFQTQNVSSNGEEIVYENRKRNSKEIEYNYLTIPRGGQYQITLADGTEVWLNSESQLKYPVSFMDGETRQVELVYGEAYFDVSPSTEHKGSKFKVFNQSQEIEVIGTEFNIKAYKDESNVYTTLVEGRVVVDNGVLKQNLMPNQQSNLNIVNNDIKVTLVDVQSEISWKNGVFSFDGKSLEEIMKVITRWYDVEVIFENKDFESIEFKGSLNKDQSIERILSIMKSSRINSYEIKNKTITLK